MYVATKFSIGLPFPIVVISTAISHKYYGINDRYINLMITNISILLDYMWIQVLDFWGKWYYLGIRWSNVADHIGNAVYYVHELLIVKYFTHKYLNILHIYNIKNN